jgi:rubrerythrin
MEKVSHQVEKAIKEAIKLEIDGRKFFQHAEEVTRHELGKKMFRRLAEEEVKHLETFSKLFSQVLKGKDWKKQVKSEELEEKSDLIQRLQASVKGEEGKGEIEALRIGMELEERAIELFGKAAEEVDDPLAQEIFLKIVDEEKFHYDLLQAQYDSLTHSGFWLDSAEFQMDGKW